MTEWFESWFDTPYYHILYQNRDYSEAEVFIQNLFQHIDLDHDKQVLDLACGKGRHAIFVNSLGYHTTGVDLSPRSIDEAKTFENDTLQFLQHDMRNPLPSERFDLVLNLFTSFGYFETFQENLKVLKAIHDGLNEDGQLVIDFFNANQVKQEIVAFEKKTMEGITFNLSKTIENGMIIKNVAFQDKGKAFNYQEKVQLIELSDFEKMLAATNFEITDIFGDYHLTPFNTSSDRLIIIAKKK